MWSATSPRSPTSPRCPSAVATASLISCGAAPAISSGADRPGAHWRATYTDALFVDDSLLLLISGRLVVLEGVGPIVWLAADGLTEDELREIALRQLPEPPVGVDAAAVIADALQRLVDLRILVRS